MHFLKISCKKCKSKHMIASRIATTVKCTQCGTLLARPSGGKAKMHSKIQEVIHV